MQNNLDLWKTFSSLPGNEVVILTENKGNLTKLTVAASPNAGILLKEQNVAHWTQELEELKKRFDAL